MRWEAIWIPNVEAAWIRWALNVEDYVQLHRGKEDARLEGLNLDFGVQILKSSRRRTNIGQD